MPTAHKLILGSCINMEELQNDSVQLVVTSPPYFNAPFDYKNEYHDYSKYLEVLDLAAKEIYRVLQDGRIFTLIIDDMLVDGIKYPITADATKVFQSAGFRYRDRIIWKKPDGYVRISKRSSVLSQNPYPMYFYPDNLLESIIIFQKGKFIYKSIPNEIREASKVNIEQFKKNRWYFSIWEITNVLPGSKAEHGIAAFPYEIPFRLISLFSYIGETVLDPFAGSGTTALVARNLERNSIGYEIREDLAGVYKEKIGFGINQKFLNSQDTFELIYKNK